MAYPIFISDEARQNLNEISIYYAEISFDLKGKILEEITKTIEKTSISPTLFQKRYKEIRIAHTEIFPYGIHFIFEKEAVYILKILHHKQFYK